MNLIRQLYDYREMIYMLVRRELRGRYKGSVLGFMWTFLNPLLQFAVYAIVFSNILRMNIDRYYIYLFVGFIPWFFLSAAIPEGANCIHSQSSLVQKIFFPRMVIPISVVLTGFINMLLSELVVFAVLLVSGFGISVCIVALPLVCIIQLLFVMGFVLIVSSLTVYFRDLSHILDILMMAWFYLTPVVYSVDMVPERLRYIIELNPMTGIIKAYQDILYYKTWPQIAEMAAALIIGVITILIGAVIFQQLQRGFAEEL